MQLATGGLFPPFASNLPTENNRMDNGVEPRSGSKLDRPAVRLVAVSVVRLVSSGSNSPCA
jgi:hypothetical protein